LAIQIRQSQKSGEFPPQFLGTCGVIFEGDSGVGKSVMIEAVLENRGIKKVDSLEDLRKTLSQENLSQQETEITLKTKPHFYYKIPASLPIEEIKKNLIIAFELGVIVVFDEMNTRIKESGLEKDINALLTGQHPTDATKNPEAGFMIIASVNEATQKGRSNFSYAIEHRSNIISANPLSEYQKKDFEKIIKNWIKNDKDLSRLIPDESTIKDTAESFQELLRKDPSAYNLRDLKKALPDIFTSLQASKGIVSPQPDDVPRETKDFLVTHDEDKNIIKFKIKSGPEESSEDPASSSFVGKFDYNKKLNDEEINLYTNNKNSFLKKFSKEKEREQILNLLKIASDETINTFKGTNLDNNFFIAVMRVASKNRGIANINTKEDFEEALKKFNPELEINQYKNTEASLHKIAKYFSAQFQSLSKNNKYYTAKEKSDGGFNDTGRRLFRVSTEENIEAFQKSEMRKDADLRTSFESPEPPSPNPTSASGSSFGPLSSPPSP